jgi:hypothetical protein
MELASLLGPMVHRIKASLKIMTSMGREFTNGLIREFMTASGRTIRWMEEGHLVGPIIGNTWVVT